jgi:hypothetical protein
MVGVLSMSLAGCFADPSPLASVRDFLLAWQLTDFTAAAQKTTGDTKAVAGELRQTFGDLDAASLNLSLGHIHASGSAAVADFTVTWDLTANQSLWTYNSQMRLREVDGEWKVVWDPSIIEPALKNGDRLAIVISSQQRAPILTGDGQSMLRTTRAEEFGVYPGALTDPTATLTRFAKIANLDATQLIQRVEASPPQSFLVLATVQLPDRSGTAWRLRHVRGVRHRVVAMALSPAMAPELVGQLGPATAIRLEEIGTPFQPGDTVGVSGVQMLEQRRLAGTPNVQVVVDDPSGAAEQVLRTWTGASSQLVQTTLNASTQSAATAALARLHVRASLVAVDPRSGSILAVANHLTGGQDDALDGKYPPGMTFGIVSGHALLESGQTSLTTAVTCPPSLTVGDDLFRGDGGGRTFQQAFATGCQTAMASLSRTLGGKDLSTSAATFGIGRSWGLPVPSYSGTVPATTDQSQLAEQTVGQGGVLVSPLAMALAAAAVDTGTWRPPQIYTAPEQSPAVQPVVLNSITATSLAQLMRDAVANGSAHAANVTRAGQQVSGVTASVTQGGTTYTWFVGYAGQTAFAVEVQGGKVPAVQVAAAFLRKSI